MAKTNVCVKGTRILVGKEADLKVGMIRACESIVSVKGPTRIILPTIQFQSTFKDKVGSENQHLMYNFKDRKGRDLCLAPEYTAVIQKLATTQFKLQKNIELFYTQQCFRGEKPQAGRYREFTQFGFEILNPTIDYTDYLVALAKACIKAALLEKKPAIMKVDLKVNLNVTRGLDYYTEGKGFEITYEGLGAQKQICGGGAYTGGCGFAIGIDRLMLIQ